MTVNYFDQASRYVAKLDPPGFLRWLLPGLSVALAFQRWLDTRTLPFPGEPDRTCDTVACLHDPEAGVWWAVAVELQGEPQHELFGRLLEYLGRLWREQRPTEERGGRYHVAAAVLNLTGAGHTSRDMELPDATGVRTALQVAERNLANEDGAATLAGIAGGQIPRALLPLVPLMQGGAEAGIIEEWRRQAEAEPDAQRRREYGGLALVFAECAGHWDVWRQALEGWNVRQSQVVQEWQAEARAETLAEALLRVLQFRFPPGAPADLAALVQATTAVDKLSNWHEAAFNVGSLDEFRQLVQA